MISKTSKEQAHGRSGLYSDTGKIKESMRRSLNDQFKDSLLYTYSVRE